MVCITICQEEAASEGSEKCCKQCKDFCTMYVSTLGVVLLCLAVGLAVGVPVFAVMFWGAKFGLSASLDIACPVGIAIFILTMFAMLLFRNSRWYYEHISWFEK